MNKKENFEIYFTRKAYVQLLTEISDYPYVETGGVLIGQRRGNTFYIFETVDPGFKADRQRAEFSRHYEYTEHLAYKVAGQYEGNTTVIGYYHRHPGSYDHFSGGDDISNLEFAQIFNGIISGLVNIDPQFRLAFYYIDPTGKQSSAINYIVDDSPFEGIMIYKDIAKLIDNIHNNESAYEGYPRRANQQCDNNQYSGNKGSSNASNTLVHNSAQCLMKVLQKDISKLEFKGYSIELSKSPNSRCNDPAQSIWTLTIKKKIWFVSEKVYEFAFLITEPSCIKVFDTESKKWIPYKEGDLIQSVRMF